MPVKDFIINRRLGVVMGTATPVSPADESTGGPGRAAGGTDVTGAQGTSEIRERGAGAISNFARKNGTSPRAEASPVRHALAADGRAVCGSAEYHLTAYRALVTCEACRRHQSGRRA